MNVIVNGEVATIKANTLAELVSHYELDDQLVVTEVDGEIIDREQWTHFELTEGQRIELVHFVGGG
ncbi:sulfur carrier protein ThiS [Halalkalibacterium halodurans]|uniref:BH1432 protein n=1 Tax=Halalkalibacterium halodurans (strain ATCC BAA-125 / DSM 18197 / FERM 7344 / JCM 9153 / C-125) TaxID=272558 RepID=Q9KCY7_HALH5|nr:sulfur carrier protein ThiS [Halalkalibacterium halodurans]MDY7221955.1 sulfur carrier protein ThiS [Halalkalibacterium halodurans]MDY7241231.1 sulfur carrier protein ThiS [Halalkalibacterium halodurans]MED4124627.1 sulfur carrier protein ThiS [Halalkalibacterium halodurans]MED4173367.1 sulfur carrier protein ThiS [Halalkalibacterium halodurans]BAB05151.1 BH1432 [Halalkalibacterium halodurans C-125]